MIDNGILINNIGELVTFNPAEQRMEIYKDTEMVVKEGQVAAIGKDLYSPGLKVVDARHKLVTPGFVDAHTHPVFIGSREQEFEQRIAGKSYQEIAAAGGGILNSVLYLRRANYHELMGQVRKHLDSFLQFGTTTIEAKSGYGLSSEDEFKSLQVLHDIAQTHPLEIYATFLGAHAYPIEYRDNHQASIDLIVNQMLPRVVREGLAHFCDAFCEEGAFSVSEARQILTAARFLGLGIRLHADEFKAIGAVQLARECGAISADHLTAITEEGIEALVAGKIVPILLPGTTFFLGHEHYAPARRLWERGLPLSLATAFNPGSCMIQSLPLIMTIACLKMHLTPLEALQATTYNAACSLRLEKRVGSLLPGWQGDFIIWKIDDYRGIPYYVGLPTIAQVWKCGKLVWQNIIDD